jgi:shikimate kinase
VAEKTVYLVGFMGSGKTAVGRILAKRLGRRFVDLDREIASSAGQSIAAIFAAEGEDGFRKRESRALRRAAGMRSAVVATGGGAVLLRDNVSLMRRTGTVVHLQAPLFALRRRVTAFERNARPLWKDAERLFRRRRSFYARAAHWRVRAGLGSPEAVAGRIARRLA